MKFLLTNWAIPLLFKCNLLLLRHQPSILFLIKINNFLLIPISEPLTHNEFTVKVSFTFAKEITNYDSSLFMASPDVESLFTNIRLKETINNCVSDFHNKNLHNGKLNKSDLFKLLETATIESSFIFDFPLYKQIDGVAMGSPLGPTLASAFLCHYEKEWLDNCPSHFKSIVYRRYVDDVFVLFLSKEHLQPSVDYMNKQYRCIKFTSETEQNDTFSFLDIKITNLKHLFIENLLSVVFLRTMKVTLINLTRSHWCSLCHPSVILFARTKHYSIWKLKN